MKTLQQIKDRMAEILKEYDPCDKTEEGKKKYSKLKREYDFLQPLALYLEKDPRPEFLQKEKDRIWNRIELIEKAFTPPKEDMHLSAIKKLKTEYMKNMDVPKLKAELKVINHLLNDAA